MMPKQDGTHKGWVGAKHFLNKRYKSETKPRSKFSLTEVGWCRNKIKIGIYPNEVGWCQNKMAPTIMTITEVGTDVGGVQAFCCAWPAGGAAEESRRKNLMSHQQKNKMTPNRNHFSIFLTQTCRYFNEGSFFCRRGPSILLCLARGGQVGGVKAQEFDVASAKNNLTPNRNHFQCF